MRFEEVLPSLREGKCINRESQPIQWAYMKLSPNGAYHWYGYGDNPARAMPINLSHDDLNATDWVVLEEDEAKGRKPAPVHFCGRRGVQGSQPNMDHWRDRDKTCSYCGSASGDDFMAFVEAGGEVGPTDKNYKAYLHGTDDLKAPGGPASKFYFQHLSAEQQTRFIELLNEKKVKVGYPGHFYNLPYFCVRVDDQP